MKILVVGAGAVGGYFGGRLAAAGEDVTFFCRGQTREAIVRDGLQIESIVGNACARPACIEMPAGFAAFDIVLWAVKTYSNEEVIPQTRPLMTERTTILSLQNGVDAVDELGGAFGPERVLGGFVSIAAESIRPGVIRHTALGRVTLGEVDGRRTERLKTCAELFGKASVPCVVSENIRQDLWSKLVWNAAFNPLSVILHAAVEELLSDLASLSMLKRAMEEVIGLAQKEGFELSPKLIERYLDPKAARAEAGEFRTSMLQDYKRGNPMEIDAISGAVVRYARRHRLAVPVNELFYDSLRYLDQEAPRRLRRSTS